MKSFKRSALIILATLLPACGQQLVEFPKSDGGTTDTAISDVAKSDGVKPDIGISDIANADVANADVPNVDVASIDAVSADAASIDAGLADTGNRDGASPDAPLIDAGIPDAGNRDSVSTDTPIIDTGIADVGNRDAGNRDADNRDEGNTDAPIGDARILDVAILDLLPPILDGASIDGANIDAANVDVAGHDARSIDVESIDGSGPGPVIVVNLGLATPFAIAATAGVTNTITAPITHINGNVVLTATPTCNAVPVDNAGGFGACVNKAPTINGQVFTDTYPDTTTAAAIKADLNAAFLSITPPAGGPAAGSLGGGTTLAAPTTLGNATGAALILGDNYFTPGVYTSGTSILITGDLTLDGKGDPNAIFIFQSASTLTTAAGDPGVHTRILLTNGTKASNVWWQVASSATIGLYCEFQGNILAAYDITMNTGSTACGRSMAGAWVGGNGAFVFDSNLVSVPGNGCPL